ncbi:MAG TPA: T9SS type A sorting domain-containing protein, partial [Salinimicrobium sp.]|nr:T9SS type A sorting domain-containing protein [Salinimicrobium sp.]
IFFREKGEGTSFSHITTIPEVMRTEIEASETDPLKFYVLAETTQNTTKMWVTNNAFANINPLLTPNDADNEIPANDFANGQAFYNLMIESDPENDQILYAGGIDLFRSNNGGNSWEQISKWSNNNNLENLPVSLVHADQHVMKFRPGNSNQAIFGHDGGVSYANNLSAASSNNVFITPERNYITTQFYSIAVAPTTFATGDYFLGGTQDNGTVLIERGNPLSIGVLGGDGAHAFYDQVETDYFIANLVYNDLILIYYYDRDPDKRLSGGDEDNFALIANNDNKDGFFINPQALDSNLDLLFSNGTILGEQGEVITATLYRYDEIKEISTIGSDGITSNDDIARRRSLTSPLLDNAISALKVSPFTTTESTVYAGLVDGKLLKIEQANGEPSEAVWTEITGPQFVGSISDIEFGNTEAEIYVTFYNYGVKNIWYTENGLDDTPTWVNKEGNLPDFPVLTILPNPFNPEEVIVGTELGVWATQNFSAGNPVWEQSYNGMSDVKVTDLDLRKGDNTVFAASYGRGMFSGKFSGFENPPPAENPAEELFVLPTISEGNLQIISEVTLGKTNVYVFDVMGQTLAKANLDIPEGGTGELNLTHLQPGLYFVRVESESITQIEKVIIR